jgi:hypothetical protein
MLVLTPLSTTVCIANDIATTTAGATASIHIESITTTEIVVFRTVAASFTAMASSPNSVTIGRGE